MRIVQPVSRRWCLLQQPEHGLGSVSPPAVLCGIGVRWKKTKVDGEIVKNNVQRVVLASRQWLPSHSAKEAFDCGLDDSDIEE